MLIERSMLIDKTVIFTVENVLTFKQYNPHLAFKDRALLLLCVTNFKEREREPFGSGHNKRKEKNKNALTLLRVH